MRKTSVIAPLVLCGAIGVGVLAASRANAQDGCYGYNSPGYSYQTSTYYQPTYYSDREPYYTDYHVPYYHDAHSRDWYFGPEWNGTDHYSYGPSDTTYSYEPSYSSSSYYSTDYDTVYQPTYTSTDSYYQPSYTATYTQQPTKWVCYPDNTQTIYSPSYYTAPAPTYQAPTYSGSYTEIQGTPNYYASNYSSYTSTYGQQRYHRYARKYTHARKYASSYSGMRTRHRYGMRRYARRVRHSYRSSGYYSSNYYTPSYTTTRTVYYTQPVYYNNPPVYYQASAPQTYCTCTPSAAYYRPAYYTSSYYARPVRYTVRYGEPVYRRRVVYRRPVVYYGDTERTHQYGARWGEYSNSGFYRWQRAENTWDW